MKLVGFEVRVHDVIGSYSGTRLSAGTHRASQTAVMVKVALQSFSNSTCKYYNDVLEVIPEALADV
jgi:IMP cyclohydrolase